MSLRIALMLASYVAVAGLTRTTLIDRVAAQETVAEPTAVTLPAPTGDYRVGVTTWHWIDPTRADDSLGRPGASREIMVTAWYPASVADDAEPAPYRPLARNEFDYVKKHSVAAAAVADMPSPAPLILLCPGRGVFADYNTAMAEDLASHGFAVFAVDSPGTGSALFPDGLTTRPSPTFRPTGALMGGPYEKVDEFFEPAVTLGAGDADFALAKIASLNRKDPANRFTGKIDMKHIGIYGHSLGGRICGDVAARNRAVKAFATMEAVPPRQARQQGEIRAAILMMYSSELPEALALPNMEEIIPNRKNDVFFARFGGLGHNSPTDLPMISDDYHYQAAPKEGLRVTRLVLNNFFDAYLRDGAFPSKAVTDEKGVAIRTYEKPGR